MKTIQNTMLAVALTCAIAATAGAVEYGQPVKEVEKEARSAVSGSCSLVPPTKQICVLTTVPAGKILAVRNVSLSCQTSTGAVFYTEGFYETGGIISNFMNVPMQNVSSYDGTTYRRGSAPAFLHVEAGNRFLAAAYIRGPVGADGHCNAFYQGFLIDKQ